MKLRWTLVYGKAFKANLQPARPLRTKHPWRMCSVSASKGMKWKWPLIYGAISAHNWAMVLLPER